MVWTALSTDTRCWVVSTLGTVPWSLRGLQQPWNQIHVVAHASAMYLDKSTLT